MKKLTLVFVPGAFPTYVPLGVATLAGYLRQSTPWVEVRVADLNIALWHALLTRAETHDMTADFFQGRVGNFYDPILYRAYQARMKTGCGPWHDLDVSVREYLMTGAEAAEMDRYQALLLDPLCLEAGQTVALSAIFPAQLPHAAALARLIKRRVPTARILLGGAAVSAVDHRALLRAVPEISALCLGEGEAGLAAYLGGAEAGGLAGWSVPGERCGTDRARAGSIPVDQVPVPDFAALPLDRYLNPTPVVPVLFSRGCRWRRCRFCGHNTGFGRYRSLAHARFADHLGALVETLGVRHFYFADQYIGVADLEGISREILSRGVDIRFHVMGRPTSDHSTETFALLFAAGCRWISWGVESGAQHLLDVCRKGTTVEAVAEVLRSAGAAGINNLAMMIFGLPGSSDAAFQETLDFATTVSPFVDAFTASSFQLFQRTPFYRQRERFGLVPREREVLFESSGHKVRSDRWSFTCRDGDGARSLPRGESEIGRWQRWRLFERGGETFFETLPAEHYLLVSAHLSDRSKNRPDSPQPIAPAPMPRSA